MKVKTRVSNMDEFSTFTALLEYNDARWSNGDLIYDSDNYYMAREVIVNGGNGYFDVDYELIDNVIVDFIPCTDFNTKSVELTIDSIIGVKNDPSFQKDLMIIREKLVRDRFNPDNWMVSESKASLSYNVTSMVTFDTFKISWCREGLTPKYNVRTMDGDVEVNAKSVKDAIVNNRLSR